MLEAQKQQHLRTLRRNINRAVTSLKEDVAVVCHSGWAYGSVRSHPWLDGGGLGTISAPEGAEWFLLLPPPDANEHRGWLDRLPSELVAAAEFFWPGPFVVRIKLATGTKEAPSFVKMRVACPWHPLMKELLARHGPLFWQPLTAQQTLHLEQGNDVLDQDGQRFRVLLWPDKEATVSPTLLDVSSRPWRLMKQGFIEFDELKARIAEPIVLSEDRAFPSRGVRKYVPEGKTIIVEAGDMTLLPEAIQSLRSQVPADSFVRIYLDEQIAHNHFPDDREVRVYGELSDPERVRRRLQAMLERQNRRFGKRILLIGVVGLDAAGESFRADLEKLSDGWLKVEPGKELRLDGV